MYTLEMHDRIRELRKNYLHLSQTAFGEKLGVSRSVINNIELNALARPDQKLSLIKLMCKEFSVSEEWLLNGTEPMFVNPDTFSLDQFVRDHGGTDLEIEIVKAYFELDKDTRLSAVNYFIDRLAAAKARAAEKEVATEIAPPLGTPEGIADAEALYESSSGYVPLKGRSVSNTTGGMASANGVPPSKAAGGE